MKKLCVASDQPSWPASKLWHDQTINWVVTRDEYLRLVDPWTDDIYPADRCTGRVSWLVA